MEFEFDSQFAVFISYAFKIYAFARKLHWWWWNVWRAIATFIVHNIIAPARVFSFLQNIYRHFICIIYLYKSILYIFSTWEQFFRYSCSMIINNAIMTISLYECDYDWLFSVRFNFCIESSYAISNKTQHAVASLQGEGWGGCELLSKEWKILNCNFELPSEFGTWSFAGETLTA